MIWGAPFKALSERELKDLYTPPAGTAMQAIWDQRYDSLTYTSGTDLTRKFFATTNADQTLSNMEAQGMFPQPQIFQIYNVCLDVLSTLPVTFNTEVAAFTSAAGVLNDIALLLMGLLQRPTWTLNIANKSYGPYSVTLLGGTGGPIGVAMGSDIATSSGSIQFARNDSNSGWNYFGKIIIPSMTSFNVTLNWFTAATMTANKLLRLSFLGVQNRSVS